MQETKTRVYDLEERTTEFAKNVIRACGKLKKSPINNRLIDQVIGASGSIGANYREANDSLGSKDFTHKVKIARREAKEALHWLDLLKEANPQENFEPIVKECTELKNILSAILKKFPE